MGRESIDRQRESWGEKIKIILRKAAGVAGVPTRLPNCCRMVANMVSPTTRAASTASSSVKSAPHLPTMHVPSGG